MQQSDVDLNVRLFRPGQGELVIVHVPPSGWLCIDGCGRDWATRIFADHLHVSPTHILMTHPHLDHAKGLVKLIDAQTASGAPTWPRLGLLYPPTASPGAYDDKARFDSQEASAVLNSIETRWELRPSCRWKPAAGSLETIGEGELLVLSPEASAVEAAAKAMTDGASFDWNRVATALLVRWKGARVVLGSDLVEKPGEGWTAVLIAHAAARDHAILKVAHHASLNAQHEQLLQRKSGEPAVVMAATPYSSSGLPDFTKGEGVAKLLEHAPEVHLTGLPQQFERQNKTPRRWERRRLAELKKPYALDEPIEGFPACYVHLAIDENGVARVVEHGPGSVVVERDRPRPKLRAQNRPRSRKRQKS